nr:CbrC family protein [Streptomyces sp. SID486]
MAVTELPAFPYHPDPIGTGAVVRSEAECASCGQARGYVYAGPVFAELQAFARPGLHCRRALLHRGRLPAVRGEGGDHQGTRRLRRPRKDVVISSGHTRATASV